jgi:hypothetical protein
VSGAAAGLAQGSSAAQHAAREILSEGRFRQPSVPRPLHGVLVALGQALGSPLSAIADVINSLAAELPGGIAGLWALLALVVVALTVWASRRSARLKLGADGPGRPP